MIEVAAGSGAAVPAGRQGTSVTRVPMEKSGQSRATQEMVSNWDLSLLTSQINEMVNVTARLPSNPKLIFSECLKWALFISPS